MKFRRNAAFMMLTTGLVAAVGCLSNPGTPGTDANSDTLAALAAKALSVSEQIGGPSGFGGAAMNGYHAHGPAQMGFQSLGDLAPATGMMTLSFRNETDTDATFHSRYVASRNGLSEQSRDVLVGAGMEIDVEIPCAEIVGVGPLERPGQPGCVLTTGEEVDNAVAVPGFIGLDYACGGTYEHVLREDVDDLDQDGSTTDLIVVSDAMLMHLENGGPAGHQHGDGSGMMGPHFSGGSGMGFGMADRAVSTADRIGGQTGFGGTMMTGYAAHAPDHMGFVGDADLAGADQAMMFEIRNETEHAAEFHVSYVVSHMGLGQQMMDVLVDSNGETTFEMPCAEIVGVGSVDRADVPGCHLNDGPAVPNTMAVPGFLGQDFVCGQTYGCTLARDINDLDGDGDTDEYVIVSDAMEFHTMNGGPGGHMHGTGPGMMGLHTGGM